MWNVSVDIKTLTQVADKSGTSGTDLVNGGTPGFQFFFLARLVLP